MAVDKINASSMHPWTGHIAGFGLHSGQFKWLLCAHTLQLANFLFPKCRFFPLTAVEVRSTTPFSREWVAHIAYSAQGWRAYFCADFLPCCTLQNLLSCKGPAWLPPPLLVADPSCFPVVSPCTPSFPGRRCSLPCTPSFPGRRCSPSCTPSFPGRRCSPCR